MSDLAKNTKATVIPCLRYRDAPAAIEWLCRAFGPPLRLDKHLVVPNSDGTIAHAQLSFGNGMVMLGSVVESEFVRLMKHPDEIEGAETQTAYVIVPLAIWMRRGLCAGESRRRHDHAGDQGRGLQRA
jgi:hypothetical protein